MDLVYKRLPLDGNKHLTHVRQEGRLGEVGSHIGLVVEK